MQHDSFQGYVYGLRDLVYEKKHNLKVVAIVKNSDTLNRIDDEVLLIQRSHSE